MPSYGFVIVDVFTDRPMTGNPLAVFPDARGLDADQMQAIAREFNLSETTFVVPPRAPNATFRLRCFSPSAEVYGAGHNALGAWWVLAARGVVDLIPPMTIVQQELGERVLPVTVFSQSGRPTSVSMTQAAPSFGDSYTNRALLARALGRATHDLEVDGLEPQAVSTGAMHLLVPVRTLASLTHVKLDVERLIEIAHPLGAHGCYLYALETRDYGSAAHARAFFPGIGIAEDPATGSAAGPLAAMLVHRGRMAQDEWRVIEQGDEMRRPSRIRVRVSGDRIEVAGSCAIVGEGTLTIDEAPRRIKE